MSQTHLENQASDSLTQRGFTAIQNNWRGIAVALVIAAAATFLSEHYGAPTMLFALLIGLALSFLSAQPALKPGLSLTAKSVLRLGVGLLGLQLVFEDVQSLGVVSVGAVIGLVVATLAMGVVLSFASSRRFAYGILSGGAVAVCGVGVFLCPAKSPETRERHGPCRHQRYRFVDMRDGAVPNPF